jgi:hypothetical protein
MANDPHVWYTSSTPTHANLSEQSRMPLAMNPLFCGRFAISGNLQQTITPLLHAGGQGFESPRLHYLSALSIPKTRIVGGSQGVSERSPSAWPRPRAFASSGERTRVTSDALSQFTHRIAMSAPPPECTLTSSSGTGSEEPQSGQLRSFSRAIRVARRFCCSESHALLTTSSVYPVPTRRRY